jgi:LemA protein
MSTIIWALVGFSAFIILIAMYIYFQAKSAHNMLVALDQRCETAFADVDVHLKHRHNLIPSLVNIVKGVTTKRTWSLA